LPILITGVQKTGSSTTYDDLMETLWLRSDVPCRASIKGDPKKGFWGCKEPHLLCWKSYKKSAYRKAWGSCDNDQEGVIADFTPENFRFPYIPARIQDVYGEEKSQEIVFLMGFREPLKRMLSAFDGGFHSGWIYRHKRPGLTFEVHVQEFLQEWDKKGGAKWIPELWKTNDYRTVDQGLYYYKIKNFLNNGFLPSQFVVYPGNVYLENRDDLASNPVLEAVRERLGTHVLRPTENNRMTKMYNKGKHNPLDDTLTNATLRRRLEEEVYGPANKRFMKLLARMVDKGMTLVGYTGEAHDVPAVTAWMEGQWDF